MLAVALALLAGACARTAHERDTSPSAADTTLAVPIAALADSSRSTALRVVPPAAVWIARVSPSRFPPSEPPLPAATPAVPEAAPAPPRLEVDPGLKPPIPRRAARLVAPAGVRGPASVELDVEVDETGRVREAVWAGGASDTALVRAAIACAHTMSFFPALRAGAPVAVWCRQRFDFAR